MLLCKLINHAVADTVDMRCVHLGHDGPLSVYQVMGRHCHLHLHHQLHLHLHLQLHISVYQVTENLNLAINAAVAIGCRVVNIGSGDLMAGSPHLVLGLLWQVVKVGIMAKINLKATPALINLLEAGDDDEEGLQALMALPPEKVLLKWLNYQLQVTRRYGCHC